MGELGYFVEYQVLNSADFGIPQNRERVFIVGHFGGEPRHKVFPFATDDRQAPKLSGHESAKANALKVGGNVTAGIYPINFEGGVDTASSK